MPTTETEHHIQIPSADEGTIKSWRKHVTQLDDSRPGASALTGHWLDGGATYELPTGAVVYGLDRTPAAAKEFRVRIWRVTTSGALKVKRDSRFVNNASVCATSVRKTLTKLLASYRTPSRLFGVGPTQVKAAPPKPNERAGQCSACSGHVAAGAGILVRDLADRLRVRHSPGGCVSPFAPSTAPAPAKPAPEPATTASVAASSRTNSRAQSCTRCWQLVPAGQGDLTRGSRGWVVTHRAECPPYPGGYTGPTWRISRGQPGGYRPVPERGFSPSEVLRASLLEREHPVPADAPGRRTAREGDGWVSAIVTVIAEAAPEYIRDEDGDSPSELIGGDGWFFQARVRIATAEEAAGILAEEADRARRAELAARRRRLLDHASTEDGTYPADGEVSLEGAISVPTGRRASLHYVPDDQIWDDPDQGTVWHLTYNGADGDNWSASNHGPYIARRLPRTPERAQLVADLIAEYGRERPTEPSTGGHGTAGVEAGARPTATPR